MEHEVDGASDGHYEQQQVNQILPFIRNRTLRQNFLQFSRGHQAARKSQTSENHFHRQHRHHEFRNLGGAKINSGVPTRVTHKAPKAWLRAVRCGTAVICTMPSGMPMPEPSTSAMMIHL